MQKKTNGSQVPSKYVVELQEIGHVVKHYAKDVYIRGTEKSLIMSVTTEQAHWIRFQLVSCLGAQIGVVSPLLRVVVEHVVK
jgi:hypothetical protein